MEKRRVNLIGAPLFFLAARRERSVLQNCSQSSSLPVATATVFEDDASAGVDTGFGACFSCAGFGVMLTVAFFAMAVDAPAVAAVFVICWSSLNTLTSCISLAA